MGTPPPCKARYAARLAFAKSAGVPDDVVGQIAVTALGVELLGDIAGEDAITLADGLTIYLSNAVLATRHANVGISEQAHETLLDFLNSSTATKNNEIMAGSEIVAKLVVRDGVPGWHVNANSQKVRSMLRDFNGFSTHRRDWEHQGWLERCSDKKYQFSTRLSTGRIVSWYRVA